MFKVVLEWSLKKKVVFFQNDTKNVLGAPRIDPEETIFFLQNGTKDVLGAPRIVPEEKVFVSK